MAGKFEMRRAKGDCTVCGQRPVNEKDRNGPTLEMVVAVGIDINWGEDLNICQVCAGVICDLMGRPAVNVVEDLGNKVADLTAKLRDKNEKLKRQGVLIDKVKEGGKAQKELKSA